MTDLPICIITGRISGDSDACGDCDPCLAAYTVPEPVKALLREKDEWRQKYSDAASELDEMRRAAIARRLNEKICREQCEDLGANEDG